MGMEQDAPCHQISLSDPPGRDGHDRDSPRERRYVDSAMEFVLMFFMRRSPRGGDKIVRRRDRGDPAAPRLGRTGAAIYATWWKRVVTLPA